MTDTPRQRQRDFDRGLQREEHPVPPGHQGPPDETISSRHDRHQDRIIERQDEELAEQERINDDQAARLAELEKIGVTAAEAGENPDANPASPYQRLRIHVPNVPTLLYMGARAAGGAVRSNDWSELNAEGFGVLTDGHVFVSAKNSANKSMMRLQSNGPLSVQTPDKLALGGGAASVLASEGGTVIAGGAGVMIHGGGAWPWSEIQTSTPDGPDTPAWITSLESNANDWGTWMSRVDGIVGLVSAYQGLKGLYNGWGKADGIAKIAGLVSNLGGSVGGAISAWGGLVNGFNSTFGTKANSFGGTTIFGSTGLILGSGVTAGFYSLLGTCIASGTSVSILAPISTSIVGKLEAELSGKSTRVNGDAEVLIRAGKTAVFGSDEHLDISAKAYATMAAGQLALVTGNWAALQADDRAFVEGKAGVEIEGSSGHVSINAKTSGTFNVSAGPLGLSAKGPVSISSPENVHISSGQFVIIAEPSSLYLGKASQDPGAPPAKPPPKEEVLKGVGKAPNRKYKSPEYQTWKAKKESALGDWKSKSDSYKNEKKSFDEKVAKIKASDVGIKLENGGIELTVKGNKIKVDASKTKYASLVIQK